jgi:hypothetical protein
MCKIRLFHTRRALLLFALTLAAVLPASAGTCDTPPQAISLSAAGGRLAFEFRYTGGCNSIYQIRSGIVGDNVQQDTYNWKYCNDCRPGFPANLDKPYKYIVQACITHLLGSSDCTPWSNAVYYLPYGPDTCVDGYVWREANSSDHVCVYPSTRTQAWQDNAAAPSRVSPTDHTYGPDTCIQGFVWREAFSNDHVCVLPWVRQQAWNDNSVAASRFARNN